MPSKTKETAIQKNNPSKKPKSNKNKSAFKKDLMADVFSVVIIGLSIVLLVSLFSQDSAGLVGQFVNKLFKGLFGVGAYILPVGAIGIGGYILFDEEKFINIPKLVMTVLLFVIVISLIHTVKYGQNSEVESFFGFVGTYYGEAGTRYGGLIGAALGTSLVALLGVTGAYILLITVIIVLSMLITGKSFLKFIHEMYLDYREQSEYEDDDEEEPETKRPLRPEPARESEPAKPAPVKEPEPVKPKPNYFERLVGSVGGKSKPVLFDLKEDVSVRNDRKILLISEEMMGVKDDGRETQREPEDIIVTGPITEPVTEIKPEGVPPVSGREITEDEFITDIYKEPKIIQAKKKEISYDIEIRQSEKASYELPPLELLTKNTATQTQSSKAQILDNAKKLEETLKSFGVIATVVEICTGPTVTRYELSPGKGVKVSKISGLSDDLALSLAAAGIRIEAPIPGKSVVGIEVPNKEVQNVFLSEVLYDPEFQNFPSKLAFGLGKDIAGDVVVWDIGKMPHLLIAGSTGSGKSVCINTLITSILYKSTPDEVKLLMIDPKVVELGIYNGIPHLLIPVVTDPNKAAGALNWAVQEMISRYGYFAEANVRDLKGYNEYRKENGEEPLPQIVIIIDELADLMMSSPKDVEGAICRLAQMARAAGLHLIIATQRPSVDVITGLIKANVPSRLAFSVSSGTDSRTILDGTGAEKLLGKGDMLFYPIGMNKPLRVQGAFVSDKEVEAIVNFLKKDGEAEYDAAMIERITVSAKGGDAGDGESDEFTDDAIEFIVKKGKASTSMLQRQFRIGYNRAARIMEELEQRGIVGEEDGSKPRQVLMTKYEWQEYKSRHADY